MSKVTITYKDYAVGAAEAATGTAAGAESFCDPADLFGGADIPRFATLEDDLWQLDGSWPLFPETPAAAALGIWSAALSGSGGAFAAPQEVDIVLSANFSSTGITLFFDPNSGARPAAVKVTWYRDSTQLDSADYAPDNDVYFCRQTVASYNKIVLIFSAMTAANRRLRLSRVVFGRVKVFQPQEYKDLAMKQLADPISDTVEDNPMTVTLRPGDDGCDYLFQAKQPLSVAEGTELIGVWYIDTHDETGVNAYDIAAIGLKGLLDRQSNHMGGIYDGTAASVVCADILGSIPYVLDSSLRDVSVYGWLPIASPRDNLLQLAFRLGAIVDDSRRDYISIRPPETGDATDALTGARAYEKGKISTSSLVTTVYLTVHRYAVSSETEQLFSGTLTGTERVEFSEPHSGLTISGGTIGSSGANYAVITGTGGAVTLTGYKYIHTTSVISRSNPLRTASDTENPRKAENMTLISPNDAAERLAALYEHYLRVRTVKGKFVTNGNYPGQRVTVDAATGKTLTGNIVSVDWKISANQAAEMEILCDAE